MRRFISSLWFPFTASLILAFGTLVALVLLKPTGADVGNDAVLKAFRIAGFAAGPVAGLLSFLMMAILNGIRRVIRLRKVSLLHPLVVLAGLAPWLFFGWELTYREPRYTAFARAAIDFVGAPLRWGSLIAFLFSVLVSLFLIVPQKKAQQQLL